MSKLNLLKTLIRRNIKKHVTNVDTSTFSENQVSDRAHVDCTYEKVIGVVSWLQTTKSYCGKEDPNDQESD